MFLFYIIKHRAARMKRICFYQFLVSLLFSVIFRELFFFSCLMEFVFLDRNTCINCFANKMEEMCVCGGCLAISVLQLIWEPIQAFVEAVAAGGARCLNVPASVSTRREKCEC